MGNTIRRTPVIRNIPAAPNFKFLNITDFKGVSLSDNPFTVPNNTASDCLNVYVDQDKALTTRPRANLDYTIKNNIPDMEKLLHTYQLDDMLVLQVKQPNGIALWVNIDKHISPVRMNGFMFTEKKLGVFKKGNVIYLCGDNNYVYFDKTELSLKNVLNDSNTYVPNTFIGDVKTGALVDDEPANILTNKYRISYNWDFNSSLKPIYDKNGVLIENGYKKTFELYSPNNKGYCLTNDNTLVTTLPGYYKESFKIHITSMEDDPASGGNKCSFDLQKECSFNPNHSVISFEHGGITYTGYIISMTDRRVGTCLLPKTVKDFTGVIVDGIIKTRNTLRIYNLIGDEIKLTNDDFTFGGELYGISDDLSYCCFGSGSVICVYNRNTEVYKYYTIGNDVVVRGNGETSNKAVYVSTGGWALLTTKNPNEDDVKKHWKLIKLDSTISIVADNTKLGGDLPITQPVVLYNKPTDSIMWSSDGADDCVAITSLEKLSTPKLVKNIRCGALIACSADFTKFIGVTTENNTFTLKISTYRFDSNYSVMERVDKSTPYSYVSYGYYRISSDLKKMAFTTAGKFTRYDFETDIFYDLYEFQGAIAPPSSDLISMWKIHYSGDSSGKISFDTLRPSSKPLLVFEFGDTKNATKPFRFNNVRRYRNEYWFFGYENDIVWSSRNNPTYIPVNNKNDLGDNDTIMDMCLATSDVALIFKKNKTFVVSPTMVKDKETYIFPESKTDLGVTTRDTALTSPLNEIPVIINSKGIYGLQQIKNVQSSERIGVLLSEKINSKYIKENDFDKILTTKYKYWMLFAIPHDKKTTIYVLDERFGEWYFWSINCVISDLWTHLEDVRFTTDNGSFYTFKTTEVLNEYNPDVTEYYDNIDGDKQVIEWRWTSQILPLSTINYSKRLVTTTFILSDAVCENANYLQGKDEYGLNYKFKAFRKATSESDPITITDDLNYVQSVTKRTMVHRFKFIQFELSNIKDDLNNNKFKLIGLGLKYTLLEGMN